MKLRRPDFGFGIEGSTLQKRHFVDFEALILGRDWSFPRSDGRQKVHSIGLLLHTEGVPLACTKFNAKTFRSRPKWGLARCGPCSKPPTIIIQ